MRGLRVVVAGATSESGAAVCAALAGAGASVIAVGSSDEKLAALVSRVPGIDTRACDLSDSAAVDRLASSLTESGGVDGLVNLVGGWVGGRGIAGQTDDAWSAMERGFRTLRNTTRALYPALLASSAGRVAFVSSTTVDAPTASGASYTASKAASESWLRSVAQGFAADQGDDSRAAAVTFVVRALVDDRMRAADPAKVFDGFTDVAVLADAVVALWAPDSVAAELNGTRIRL
jgi:NADP-dependent 3-hydroxy acid dehydrogenase YdfG